MAVSAAAAAAAIARAIKASGVIVRVTPQGFDAILKRAEKPLVIHAQGGIFSTRHQYFVSYKGFAFTHQIRDHTRSALGRGGRRSRKDLGSVATGATGRIILFDVIDDTTRG